MKKKNWFGAGTAIAAVLAGMCLLAAVLAGSISRYSNTLIKQQQDQMLRIVRSVGSTIHTYIDTEKELLCREASRGYGSMEELRAAMAEYRAMKPHARANLLLVDGRGRVLMNIRDREAAFNYQKPVFDYELPGPGLAIVPGTYMEAGRGCLVPVVTPVSVLGQDGPLYMAVFLDFGDMDRVIDNAALLPDIRGYFVVKDQDGYIMSHESREQIGLQAVSGRLEHYPGIDISGMQKLMQRQLSGSEGTFVYDSYWFSDGQEPQKARKFSAFAPLAMDRGFWVVSLTMDYNDFIGPFHHLMAESLVIIVAIFAFAGMAALALIQTGHRQKELLRQTQYLTELNRAMTELNQTREQAKHSERLQMVGVMTSGLSHEFNNILAPILGYSELLVKDLPDDCLSHSDAWEIYEAACRAKDLVAQITALSQKSADQAAYRDFDFQEAMGKWVKSVQLIKPENIAFRAEIGGERALVHGNPTQLYEVLLNLCVNAFYEMKAEGRLTVRAAVAAADELPEGLTPLVLASRFVLVRVEDTGNGISPEILENIFTPFFTTKKHGEGTGLGLAITQKILNEHQGAICVEALPEQGTSFCYCLPVAEGAAWGEAAKEAEEQDRQVVKEQWLPGRILAVDDDESWLKLLARVLGKYGLATECCTSPQKALKLLKKYPGAYQFLITDYQMDEMNGDVLAGQARFLDQDLKILVISGFIKSEIVDACQKGRIDGYLLKPVHIEQLISLIRDGKI